jgi:hypothetical protein
MTCDQVDELGKKALDYSILILVHRLRPDAYVFERLFHPAITMNTPKLLEFIMNTNIPSDLGWKKRIRRNTLKIKVWGWIIETLKAQQQYGELKTALEFCPDRFFTDGWCYLIENAQNGLALILILESEKRSSVIFKNFDKFFEPICKLDSLQVISRMYSWSLPLNIILRGPRLWELAVKHGAKTILSHLAFYCATTGSEIRLGKTIAKYDRKDVIEFLIKDKQIKENDTVVKTFWKYRSWLMRKHYLKQKLLPWLLKPTDSAFKDYCGSMFI